MTLHIHTSLCKQQEIRRPISLSPSLKHRYAEQGYSSFFFFSYLHCWWIMSLFFSTTWLFLFKCPQKVNICISQFPRDWEEVFKNPCFNSPTLQKRKEKRKGIKQKILPFEEFEPAEKANLFCFQNKPNDWLIFKKKCFNFMLTWVLQWPLVDSFGLWSLKVNIYLHVNLLCPNCCVGTD